MFKTAGQIRGQFTLIVPLVIHLYKSSSLYDLQILKND